jgi:hypothetical protein
MLQKNPNSKRYNSEYRSEYQKKWVLNNKDKVKEYHRKSRERRGEELKKYKRNWRIRNWDKYQKCQKGWYLKNKERLLKKARTAHLKRQYGITENEYSILFNSQNGKCAICDRLEEEVKERLEVDHDHLTGKIRGLLCGQCNRGLGSVRDNIDLLGKMIIYVNKFQNNNDKDRR